MRERIAMALRAVEAKSLPDQVFAQLVGEIVSGGYQPGSKLPSERTLTDVFAVNRHVVREALGRLEQIGLVRTSQGGRTQVLDFTSTAGLDLLVLIAEHAEAIEGVLPLLGAAMEMRAGIGVDVARLCAQRAGGAVAEELSTVAERLAEVGRGPELLALDQRFWQHVLQGAGNLAYQLAFNSLIRGVNAVPELSEQWLEHELEQCDYRRNLAAAIGAGDPELAAAAAREALAVDARAVTMNASKPAVAAGRRS
jgi:GntR family transcriptional regulator, transcriptional repressor for pyruvate dehydrogenase complex